MATDPTETAQRAGVAWLFFERINGGDVKGAFELMAPGATFWTNGTRAAHPADVMESTIARLFEYMPIQMTLSRSIRSGDSIVLECESRGVTPDGRDYHNVYAFIVEVANERIRSIREYADTNHGAKRIPADIFTTPGPGVKGDAGAR